MRGEFQIQLLPISFLLNLFQLRQCNNETFSRIIIDLSTVLRKDDGLDVLLVTDVTKHGEKATTFFWEFSVLENHMKEGKLNFLRFNFLDIQVRKHFE